ncbi:hypothetical protein [Rhodoferax sp. GW822-FHT02A01]|uniref:hypothetical protein n=1 Tax=Rhodoferax sp. GW822-FHT02A01 TaxID=3141537 RepID=UPI00315D911E
MQANKAAAEATTSAAPVAPAAAPSAPVAKPAAKASAKPAKPAKKVAAKPAAKPAAKKPVAKVAKPAAKPEAKAAPKATKPAEDKAPKEKKIKMVRDSISIPKNEYVVLDALKLRAGKLAAPAKKTELIRAGIKALAAMSDSAFVAAVRAVPSLKTGRPAKAA